MELEDGTVRKLLRRFNLPFHAHELTFSCYRRLPLLSKDRTRQWFVEALDAARQKHDVALWAYVVMPEHAHVLVFPRREEYAIGEFLKSVKQSVARKATIYLRKNSPGWLERLKVTWPTGRVEYRFWQQGSGFDREIFNPEAVWASIKYLHRNPVRRGLVACPMDWMWSSARWYGGERDGQLRIDEDGLFE